MSDRLVLFAPEHSLLVDDPLVETSEAFPDKRVVVKNVRVDAGPWQILDEHEELAVAWAVLFDLRLAQLEDSKCVAVQSPWPFHQEGVPYAKYSLDGQDANEERHEPRCTRQGHGRLAGKFGIRVSMRSSAGVDEIGVVDRSPHLGKIVLDEHHKDVYLRICKRASVSARKVVLCDDREKDECFLFVLFEKEKK